MEKGKKEGENEVREGLSKEGKEQEKWRRYKEEMEKEGKGKERGGREIEEVVREERRGVRRERGGGKER